MTWVFDDSRVTHVIRIDNGEVMTFAECLSHYGKAASYLVRRRIREGWDVEKAFTTPPPKEETWTSMSTSRRVELIKRMAADGMLPPAMAEKIPGITAKKISFFCWNHNISYGAGRLKKDERPPEGGVRLHSAAIDPKTMPSSNGVPFLMTNNNTCRWPLWSGPDGPASERLCCGEHTEENSLYCIDHNLKAKVKVLR